MAIDFLVGIALAAFAWLFGLGALNSFFAFASAWIIDIDILLMETWRILFEKKKIGLSNFLDEYSYRHKFVLHHPMVVPPAGYVFGYCVSGHILAILIFMGFFYHLFHDSIDANFDGVRWNIFSPKIYKIRFNPLRIEHKTKEMLFQEATKKSKRTTGKILNDNIL